MKHALTILLVSAMIACGQVQYAFTNFAGWPGGFGNVDGTGSAACFSGPTGVAVDSAGTVYVADRYNSTIRKITPAGEVTTLAGSAGQQGIADGTGSAARFYGPSGLAVDTSDNVYVADTANHTIRKITPAGEVTTLAGNAGYIGSDDGTGSEARFYYPSGVAVDGAGNVYVADSENRTIRKITPAGEVTTLAGSAREIGSDDGSGSAARFSGLNGVSVDGAGNVYVADDRTAGTIVKWGARSTLRSIAEDGTSRAFQLAARQLLPQKTRSQHSESTACQANQSPSIPCI